MQSLKTFTYTFSHNLFKFFYAVTICEFFICYTILSSDFLPRSNISTLQCMRKLILYVLQFVVISIVLLLFDGRGYHNCWCLEIITKYFIHIQDNVFIGNIPFAHCRFDSKIICFYTFYAS
jgi:hypothetical protein